MTVSAQGTGQKLARIVTRNLNRAACSLFAQALLWTQLLLMRHAGVEQYLATCSSDFGKGTSLDSFGSLVQAPGSS